MRLILSIVLLLGTTPILFGQFTIEAIDSNVTALSLKESILGKPIQLYTPSTPITKPYNPLQLSFFCKREALQWNDKSLPAYFRLGSKDEVDRLEQKNNFIVE